MTTITTEEAQLLLQTSESLSPQANAALLKLLKTLPQEILNPLPTKAGSIIRAVHAGRWVTAILRTDEEYEWGIVYDAGDSDVVHGSEFTTWEPYVPVTPAVLSDVIVRNWHDPRGSQNMTEAVLTLLREVQS